MKKMMKYSLPIAKIDKIDLPIDDIEEHFLYSGIYYIYLVHPHFLLHLSQKYFKIPKSVLYMKKLAIGILITFNKSVMT